MKGIRQVVCAVLVAAATAGGAHGATAQPVRDVPPTFRGGVEAVTLSVTVRDQRGRPVKGLTRRDLIVFDSGTPRTVRGFIEDEAAISLAVLLDISGSMAVGGNMDRARRVVSETMARLQPGRDEAALLTFDSTLQEVRAFTKDLARVTAVNLAGTPWGLTSLYDALGETARKVATRPNPHRAVLVITDGVDTGSRLSAAEVSGIASEIQVPVYLVVVAAPVDNPAERLALLSVDGRAASTATLADLARWTGGDMAIVSTPAEFTTALDGLVAELRHQYVLTFEPDARPGWHPIEVRSTRKRLAVHARGGYMSGTGAAMPTPE
ncbi:MAG: VWA domain-containing protein [Vicinamibacterales bacterium]